MCLCALTCDPTVPTIPLMFPPRMSSPPCAMQVLRAARPPHLHLRSVPPRAPPLTAALLSCQADPPDDLIISPSAHAPTHVRAPHPANRRTEQAPSGAQLIAPQMRRLRSRRASRTVNGHRRGCSIMFWHRSNAFVDLRICISYPERHTSAQSIRPQQVSPKCGCANDGSPPTRSVPAMSGMYHRHERASHTLLPILRTIHGTRRPSHRWGHTSPHSSVALISGRAHVPLPRSARPLARWRRHPSRGTTKDPTRVADRREHTRLQTGWAARQGP